jgi:predicted nucleotidyltransferase
MSETAVMTENFAWAGVWSKASQGFQQGWPLPVHTLVAGIMGSMSHGTYVAPTEPNAIDDIDVMVICQPPRRFVYGLHPWDYWCPPVGTLGEVDLVAYSVRKFTGLLLKGNPNVVGLLWLPDDKLVFRSEMWAMWRESRHEFLSKRVYASFVGYAVGQLQRLGKPNTRGYMGRERKALFEQHGYDPKNAAHCLRLLRMGLELMETGELNVDRTGIDVDELRAVKAGKWTLGQIQREADRGLGRLEAAKDASTLPDRPNEALAEGLMMATIETLW